MIHFILLDIEGTTTDIAFVHKVLFPYSAERLETFVAEHASDPEVQSALKSVVKTVYSEDRRTISVEEAVQVLLYWIQTDRKHTALKLLQGKIWKSGFENGDYQGHVYPDVPEALAAWRETGIRLGIYSSGSVQAQKLLFGYSLAGDLTPYFSHYFDTNVGGKKESESYRIIAGHLQLPPREVLFLSDVEAELEAAAEAGMQVMQLLREGTVRSDKFQAVASLTEINPLALAGSR
jgi:enolase-phosphatase E1